MPDGRVGGFFGDVGRTLRGSVAGLRGVRVEREARREAARPAGLVGASRNQALRGNQTLSVFEDRVELSTLNALSADTERVRYGRIAAVSRRAGLSYSALVIETTGGKRLVVKGLPKAKAAEAARLIEERLP